MQTDLFVVDHFWNLLFDQHTEDVSINYFTTAFIQFFRPFLNEVDIQKVLHNLYRYLKRKHEKKSVSKKQFKKVVFRDCQGILAGAVFGHSNEY